MTDTPTQNKSLWNILQTFNKKDISQLSHFTEFTP